MGHRLEEFSGRGQILRELLEPLHLGVAHVVEDAATIPEALRGRHRLLCCFAHVHR